MWTLCLLRLRRTVRETNFSTRLVLFPLQRLIPVRQGSREMPCSVKGGWKPSGTSAAMGSISSTTRCIPPAGNLIELVIDLQPERFKSLIERLEHPVMQARAAYHMVAATRASDHRKPLLWITEDSCDAFGCVGDRAYA